MTRSLPRYQRYATRLELCFGSSTAISSLIRQKWTVEATALWDEYDTPGEFNSPTYAGITLMAFGAAQYCPPDSAIAKVAPKLILSVWRSLGESYNPTLLNVAGPWDRGYGFCMTQYFASIGLPIAAFIGLDKPSKSGHVDQSLLSSMTDRQVPCHWPSMALRTTPTSL